MGGKQASDDVHSCINAQNLYAVVVSPQILCLDCTVPPIRCHYNFIGITKILNYPNHNFLNYDTIISSLRKVGISTKKILLMVHNKN